MKASNTLQNAKLSYQTFEYHNEVQQHTTNSLISGIWPKFHI